MYKKVSLLSLLIFIFSTAFAQNQPMRITTVRGNNLISNQGSNFQVKVGDSYNIVRNNNLIGSAKVLIVKSTMSGLKITELYTPQIPGIGDFLVRIKNRASKEEELFDEMDYVDFNSYTSEVRPRNHNNINRKGFIIGIGVGYSYLSADASYAGISLGSGETNSFATNFKIGYAPSDNLEIYYSSKVSWWNEFDIILTNAISSFAFTLYPNKMISSGFFLSSGIGIAAIDAPAEDVEPSVGIGLFGGIGYEFSKHWNFETSFDYSRITDTGVILNMYSIMLTLNVLAY